MLSGIELQIVTAMNLKLFGDFDLLYRRIDVYKVFKKNGRKTKPL